MITMYKKPLAVTEKTLKDIERFIERLPTKRITPNLEIVVEYRDGQLYEVGGNWRADSYRRQVEGPRTPFSGLGDPRD